MLSCVCFVFVVHTCILCCCFEERVREFVRSYMLSRSSCFQYILEISLVYFQNCLLGKNQMVQHVTFLALMHYADVQVKPINMLITVILCHAAREAPSVHFKRYKITLI